MKVFFFFLIWSLNVFGRTPTPQEIEDARQALLSQTANMNLEDLGNDFVHKGKTYQPYQFRDIVDDIIKREIREKTPQEQRDFLADYLADNSSYLGEFTAFKAACALTKAECSKREQERGHILANINTMYSAIHGANGKNKFESEVCEANIPLIPNQDFWSQFAKLTRNSANCSPLKPNEFRKVRSEGFASEYTIRRSEDGKHQILLNLDFEYKNGNLTTNDMMSRMRLCMQRANPVLSTPDQPMEIVVLGKDDAEKIPPAQRPASEKITLEGPEFRSNSGNYSDTARCDTLVHEALHLLGLCDEYHERVKPDFTCRIVTTTPSIMADSNIVFPRTVPQSVTCDCPADSICGEIMASTDSHVKNIYLSEAPIDMGRNWFWSDYCTQGEWKQLSSVPARASEKGTVSDDGLTFTVIQRTVISNKKYVTYHEKTDTCRFKTTQTNPVLLSELRERFREEQRRMYARIDRSPMRRKCPITASELSHVDEMRGTPGASLSGNILTINSPSEGGSLLHPNHVTKILAGNCDSKATNYRRCAELAYSKIEECNQQVREQCSEENFLRVSGDATTAGKQ